MPFLLREKLGFSLPECVAKVSCNIADMVGLPDRGEIAVGRRADLVRVRQVDSLPVIPTVWREGVQVA